LSISNFQLQGFDKNIFEAHEKVKGFLRNFCFGLNGLILGILQFSQLFLNLLNIMKLALLMAFGNNQMPLGKLQDTIV
jgi:hypothetical protein